MFPKTPLAIAKATANALVSMNVASLTRSAIDNHTDIDADSIPAIVGSAAVGYAVASKLEPYTDALVEKAASLMPRRNKNKIPE